MKEVDPQQLHRPPGKGRIESILKSKSTNPMKIQFTCWFALAALLWVSPCNLLAAEVDTAAKSSTTAEAADYYKFQVFVSSGETDVEMATAYFSPTSTAGELDVSIPFEITSNVTWSLNISGILNPGVKSMLYFRIEDLSTFRPGQDSTIIPLSLFFSQVKPKGPGTYSVGNIMGKDIKFRITEVDAKEVHQP